MLQTPYWLDFLDFTNKNNSKHTHISEHMTVIRSRMNPSLNDSINREDSLINGDLLPPTGGFDFIFKVTFII